MKKIALAGGCFWGVEAYFNLFDGIIETKVGYANGDLDNPNYTQVKTGNTGHAETLLLEYDESIISLDNILTKYWAIIDPTIKDRQGPDIGSQYRTGIYYIDATDLETILLSKENEQLKYTTPIVTEIQPLRTFFDAETYHQKYLDKNPNGYCHIDINKYR